MSNNLYVNLEGHDDNRENSQRRTPPTPHPPRTKQIPPLRPSRAAPLPPRPNSTPPQGPTCAEATPPPRPSNAQSTSTPPSQHVQSAPAPLPLHARPTLAPPPPNANRRPAPRPPKVQSRPTSPPLHSQSTSTSPQPHVQSTNPLPPHVPPPPPPLRAQSRPTSPPRHSQSTSTSAKPHDQSTNPLPPRVPPPPRPPPPQPPPHVQSRPTSSQLHAQSTSTLPLPQSQSKPEDPKEMEEELKKLGKISSSLPPVLIRKTLFCDDREHPPKQETKNRGRGYRGRGNSFQRPGEGFQVDVGHGQPPKPETKNRGRGYRGRCSSFQTPGEGFQVDVGDQSQVSHRQYYSEEGASQQLFSSDFVDSNLARHSTCDDCLRGPFVGDDPNRPGQGNCRRSRVSGNIGRDQRGLRFAQTLSSFTDSGDQSACKARAIQQSRFHQNQLLVGGLSALTTEDCLVNFIEAISCGQVEDVMQRNDKALITMASEITDFSKVKTRGEKRGLDSAKVTIEQVPVSTSIVVSGISDNTTHDAIELYFESRRYGGGPVERVEFTPKSGSAVVVFQDPKDIKGVLTRQKEKPHVLDQARLSIRNYHEFLESQESNVLDDSDGLGTTSGGADKAQVSQQVEIKGQTLHMAVDPDVIEFANSTAFHDQLRNSLAAKKNEIIWKPNNKVAEIVHQGGDDSDSWQSECIDEVQNYLSKFAKRDVQVNKDFWSVVVAQLSSIRACLGVDPAMVKLIEDSFVTRIVSLRTVVMDYEEKIRSKLEEIYREETRKNYSKKKVSNVPKERLILLKKIMFVEKLQEKNKELEIKLDTEDEEIYFEGPQRHVSKATEMLQKQMSDMVENKLTVSDSILEVLGSEAGLMKVKCELESNNVEAVFVIGKDARVVGTSSAHADNAASLVKKLFESDSIREEKFVCSSPIVRRYLSELCQEDLLSIEDQLKDFEVKIKKGNGEDDIDISGTKKGLARVREKLDALTKDNASERFDVKQTGLQKFFDSGKGDRLVKSVEKEQDCVIHVQKNFGQRRDDSPSQAEGRDYVSSACSESNDDGIIDDDDDDLEEEEEQEKDDDHAGSGSAVSTLVTLFTESQQKISLRTGYIEKEKADVLVSSEPSEAIGNAHVPVAAPNVEDVTVYPGLPLARYVIRTKCCQWNNGKGEATLRDIVHKCLQKSEELGVKSIAFPVIRIGNLNFPRDAVSRIFLKETISFCQAHPGSKVQDIRFVVSEQDQALTAAFKQEMNKLRAKNKLSPFRTKSGLLNSIKRRIKFPRRVPGLKECIHTRVLQGDVCQETTNRNPSENDTAHGQLWPRQKHRTSHDLISVRICVLGKRTADVEKATESLRKGFSEACATDKVEHEVVSQLSRKQIASLKRKAEDRDVKLVVEADVDRIVVQGQPTEVSGVVGEIWKEISERTKRTQEEEQAQLVSRNIEWSYEIRGSKMVFGRKNNAKIETAWSKDEPRVQVSLRGEQFVIDLKAKTARRQRTNEQITLKRKVKGVEEGISLPEYWDPMPSTNMTVHKVELSPSSSEYQAVLSKFQTSAGGVNIHKIERIQNPHLYQCYMVRKQKMDKELGRNNERQLFHGTDAKNVSHINTQGFNRSFCGTHGVAFGRGTYFARDAKDSIRYAEGGVGSPRYMYLARVLVGQYCVGDFSMIVPPAKNKSRPAILYESVVDYQGNPSIFVVFCDNQCYPEYLITMAGLQCHAIKNKNHNR